MEEDDLTAVEGDRLHVREDGRLELWGHLSEESDPAEGVFAVRCDQVAV